MAAAKQRAGDIRIGISGWNYAAWRGVFYPPKLPHKREFAHASHAFRSIEINGTHYSLQRPEDFARWDEETPADFVFAIKGSRYITHMKRLREPEAGLANFFAQGLLRLGPKLGPILWQFPPNSRFDRERIEPFLALLPRDTEAALAIARRHDRRVAGRTWLKIDKKRRLRHAMEIRHDSFVNPDFIALLRKYSVALVSADTVDWPLLMDVTSDFIYAGSMARSSSMRAATMRKPSLPGPSASLPGRTAGKRPTASAPVLVPPPNASVAMSSSISIMTRKCARLSMRKLSWRRLRNA